MRNEVVTVDYLDNLLSNSNFQKIVAEEEYNLTSGFFRKNGLGVNDMGDIHLLGRPVLRGKLSKVEYDERMNGTFRFLVNEEEYPWTLLSGEGIDYQAQLVLESRSGASLFASILRQNKDTPLSNAVVIIKTRK